MINASRESATPRRQMAVWRDRFPRLPDRSHVPTAISRPDGSLLIANSALATL
ncbi:hypothetical protein ACFV0T_29620 [Streptomyces sp. NPDC059582]|uniref:hypothetical protein n=1 Tax=Streptomyces sp. NPDC059582 TaxID=3346875 RepID=UPI0036C31A52